MTTVWVVFDWDEYDGSLGPQSVWSTEELAEKEIRKLLDERPYTEFRCEEFEVD